MKKILLPAFCGLFAFTLTASADVVMPTLTLTEVSSTQLTWSWSDNSGSGSVANFNGTADLWKFDVAAPFSSFFDALSGNWIEDADHYNQVLSDYNSTVSGRLYVSITSDVAGAGSVAGGSIVQSSLLNYQIRFIDLGDSSNNVPDGGNTLLLLLLAGGTRVWVQRRRVGSGV